MQLKDMVMSVTLQTDGYSNSPRFCMSVAQAVQQLDELDAPNQDWLVPALLRRLADDDFDVVAPDLTSKAALHVPAAGLLEAVEAAMLRAWEALHGKEQGVSSSKALDVIKSVSSCHRSPHLPSP